MNISEISKARHAQMAIAFRAGRKAAARYLEQNKDSAAWAVMFAVGNPFAERGGMPENTATVRGAMWSAYRAGIERAAGEIMNASTYLRNARFFMRRATELGRA